MPIEPRLSARDFDPEVMRLFDQYVHGRIDRRGFLEGAARHAPIGVTAAMLLEALNPRFAEAQQVKPDDARLVARFVEIDSPAGYGKVRGYLVKRKDAAGKLPGVLVVHENRGLNPHIEDVTRRVALENFVAFAPDALFPLGGYPGDEDKARAAFAKLDQVKTREDFAAAAEWLRALGDVGPRVGVVGFCYGGAMSNLLAVRLPWLAAAVPFYGGSQPTADAAKIKAALMIHNAEKDDWVNTGAAAYEQALKAAGVRLQAFSYPGTQHGFNNDTTPRYDEPAARLAWQRTVAFFNAQLRT
ncbi:MAG: dienelactone hydrolase family protein [Burkholderiales bacterium]|nr:dienelactone hydrolase family protein [Burkholderiales bacterium]